MQTVNWMCQRQSCVHLSQFLRWVVQNRNKAKPFREMSKKNKITYRDRVGSVRDPALSRNWSSSDRSLSISSASWLCGGELFAPEEEWGSQQPDEAEMTSWSAFIVQKEEEVHHYHCFSPLLFLVWTPHTAFCSSQSPGLTDSAKEEATKDEIERKKKNIVLLSIINQWSGTFSSRAAILSFRCSCSRSLDSVRSRSTVSERRLLCSSFIFSLCRACSNQTHTSQRVTKDLWSDFASKSAGSRHWTEKSKVDFWKSIYTYSCRLIPPGCRNHWAVKPKGLTIHCSLSTLADSAAPWRPGGQKYTTLKKSLNNHFFLLRTSQCLYCRKDEFSM